MKVLVVNIVVMFFICSMLPQYMALCVSELVSFVSSKKKFKPLLSKVGG